MPGLLARRVAAIVFIAVFALSVAGALAYSTLSSPARRAATTTTRPVGSSQPRELQPINLSEVIKSIEVNCSNSSTNLAASLFPVLRVVNSTYLTYYGIPYLYSAARLGQGVMRFDGYTINVTVTPEGDLLGYSFTLYLNGSRVNSTTIVVDYPIIKDFCSSVATASLGNVSLLVLTHYGAAYLIAVEAPQAH